MTSRLGVAVNLFLKISARLLGLAFVLAFARPVSALETYPSNEGSYSINFPVAPQESVREIGPNRLIARAIRDGDLIYVAAHGDFAEAVKADIEMKLNIENYAREVGATVTSQKPVTIPRGGKTLNGIEFVYDGERLNGKGIVVVDGTSSYLVAASSVKPASHAAAVDAFLNSFHLLQKP